MKLTDLIKDIPVVSIKGDINLDITAMTKDSRTVQEGALFFATARSGSYIDDALKKGAHVLVTDR